MTEVEWLAGNDPEPMLSYLQQQHASERKLRLLSCACCRQIWHLLPDPRSRRAVAVAERYADGLASPVELARARRDAVGAADRAARQAAWAAYSATSTKASGPLVNAFAAAVAAPARQAAQAAQSKPAAAYEAIQTAGCREQASLVREVIGNPFRPSVIHIGWLEWSGGIVVQLAKGIYEDRAFDRMPILGDALEEAGCSDETILMHCRQSGAHVCGCWVVDALLEKE